jgi:hypothetical protein
MVIGVGSCGYDKARRPLPLLSYLPPNGERKGTTDICAVTTPQGAAAETNKSKRPGQALLYGILLTSPGQRARVACLDEARSKCLTCDMLQHPQLNAYCTLTAESAVMRGDALALRA